MVVMTQATDDVDSAGVPDKPSRARRMIHILGAALVGVVLPVVVLYALLGDLGSRAMVIGLLLGVLGSKRGEKSPQLRDLGRVVALVDVCRAGRP
jgi:hypothetical protein